LQAKSLYGRVAYKSTQFTPRPSDALNGSVNQVVHSYDKPEIAQGQSYYTTSV